MSTRDELLASYRAIRAAIQRVLKKAPSACVRADWMRAAKLLGLEMGGQIVLGDDDQEASMLTDIALFEPNARGNRAFDRFLTGTPQALPPADREVARDMAGAFFSIFHFAGRHEATGIWLEDLLDDGRRIWMVDEALEASVPDGITFAARLFDAGPFHAGFGIFVPLDAASVEGCVEIKRATGKTPFGRRFVPLIYGSAVHGAALSEITHVLLAALAGDSAGAPERKAAPRRAPKKHR